MTSRWGCSQSCFRLEYNKNSLVKNKNMFSNPAHRPCMLCTPIIEGNLYGLLEPINILCAECTQSGRYEVMLDLLVKFLKSPTYQVLLLYSSHSDLDNTAQLALISCLRLIRRFPTFSSFMGKLCVLSEGYLFNPRNLLTTREQIFQGKYLEGHSAINRLIDLGFANACMPKSDKVPILTIPASGTESMESLLTIANDFIAATVHDPISYKGVNSDIEYSSNLTRLHLAHRSFPTTLQELKKNYPSRTKFFIHMGSDHQYNWEALPDLKYPNQSSRIKALHACINDTLGLKSCLSVGCHPVIFPEKTKLRPWQKSDAKFQLYNNMRTFSVNGTDPECVLHFTQIHPAYLDTFIHFTSDKQITALAAAMHL